MSGTPLTHITVLAITQSLQGEKRLSLELTLGTRRIRQLSIERFAIAKTAAKTIEIQKVFVHAFQRLQESARLMSLSSQPSCSLTNTERRH